MISNAGRSRRPWCYHKRGISLDDNLGAANDIDDFLHEPRNGSSPLCNMEKEEEDDDALHKRFGRLLSCEDMADVHFIVGNGNNTAQKLLRIPAHKLILSASSPVFKSMFFGPMAESDNPEPKDIELPDIEPIVFLEFLRYVYTDQINLKRDNAIAVLYAAKKYDIPGLERLCINYLKYSINEKNALIIWTSAKLFDEREFEMMCLKIIERNAHYVLLSPDFLRLDFETMCSLVTNDSLCIDEIDVFRAVARWAKNDCLRNGICPTRVNIRELLGDAINLIRFPLMTEEQLSNKVASEGILEDEILQMLIHHHKTWPRMSAQSIKFSDAPRNFQRFQNPMLSVQRFNSYDNQLPNRFTNRSLSFTVSDRIFIAGIGLYGPKRACTFYLRVSFAITKCGCTKPTLLEQAEKSVTIQCDGTTPIINIKLDYPFEVDPETCYDITAKLSPTNRATSIVRSKFNPHLHYNKAQEVNYYYGTGGQSVAEVKVPNLDHQIVFTFSWTQLDDAQSETSACVPAASTSAPPTPNPPPRPPPPKEYRRSSKIEKLKRALSFTASDSRNANHTPEDKYNLLAGQIPVILFYA